MIFAEKLIKNALKEASTILMSNFGEMIEGNIKESQSSIVTEMDVAAERKIAHIITGKYPGHGIIGEEKGVVLTGSEYTWVIDPIDGTSNYAAGIPWFGTLIALFQNDTPLAAGAYLPYYDLLYYAEQGKGAFCNDKPLQVTRETSLKNLLFAYATDWSDNTPKVQKETDLLRDIIQHVRNMRATNCLIDFCFVADGRFGGNINHKCKIWDIAAPYLLIREAGGVMTDLQGNDIRFGLSIEDYMNDYKVMASGSNCFDELLSVVNKHF